MIPFEEFLRGVAQSAFSNVNTLRASYLMARDVVARDIPGDFVECGVAAGANAAMLGRTLQETGPTYRNRKLHLFDTFSGVPAPSAEDTEWIAAGHPVGTSACSLERVADNMRQWGIPSSLLSYNPGLFSVTVPMAVRPRLGYRYPMLDRIALLRLDGDLYESTRVCLEHLYPLVSPGGWVIIDDYGLDGCRKAVQEYMLSKGGGFCPTYWQKQ